VKNISNLTKQESIEIAHLHNIYHQLTPSIIPALKRQGVKIVLTLQDCKLVCPSYLALKAGEICSDCDGRKFYKPFTSNCQQSRVQGLLLAIEAYFHKWCRSYDAVDLFLAPSQFLADLISKRIPREKIRVLRNGIDVESYVPYYEDCGYGLYFGRLSKEKGVSTLLQAQASIDSCLPLKVVGTGPLQGELEAAY
jgi:glycosyltransferase involved in cell wall biosynthesis